MEKRDTHECLVSPLNSALARFLRMDAPLAHYDCTSASTGTFGCDSGYAITWYIADERGSVLAETGPSSLSLF